MTGRVIISAEYAQNHSIKDIDNRTIYSLRQVKYLSQKYLPENLRFLSNFIPAFVKIPQFLIDIMNSKF